MKLGIRVFEAPQVFFKENQVRVYSSLLLLELAQQNAEGTIRQARACYADTVCAAQPRTFTEDTGLRESARERVFFQT